MLGDDVVWAETAPSYETRQTGARNKKRIPPVTFIRMLFFSPAFTLLTT